MNPVLGEWERSDLGGLERGFTTNCSNYSPNFNKETGYTTEDEH